MTRKSAIVQKTPIRDGADRAVVSGLARVNYSTFSKKAQAVPFELLKKCFHLVLQKSNRQMKRELTFPKELLLIDSTMITVGRNRLPWAPFHSGRAGDYLFPWDCLLPICAATSGHWFSRWVRSRHPTRY